MQRRSWAARASACAARLRTRELDCDQATVWRDAERLGRPCLLFHEKHRPRTAPDEDVVIDGFESFELSQYHPFHLNIAIGAESKCAARAG